MRIFISFILFSIFSLFVHAQGGYFKGYTPNDYGALFANILVHEDTLIVYGLSTPDNDPGGQGLLFLKMDTLGNVLLKKTHVDAQGRYYYWGGPVKSMVKYKDNSGYLLKTKIGGDTDIRLIKLDNYGEKVWEKTYSDSLSMNARNVNIIEVDNGFLIAYHTQTTRTHQFDMDLKVMKITKDGNQLWSRYYGSPDLIEAFTNFYQIDANNFAIGGNESPGSSSTIEWIRSKFFIIDSLGNVMFDWVSSEGFENIGVIGMNRNAKDEWQYLAVREEVIPGKSLIWQPKFVTRDSSFNLIEEKIYGEPGFNQFLIDMIPMSSGGYVVVGQNRLKSPLPSPWEDIATWMLRLDEKGDTMWTHINLMFPDSQGVYASEQYLNSVVELSSGSVVASGVYVGEFHFPDRGRGILIKVDKNGCLDTLLCPPVVSTTFRTQESSLKVFPNPATSTVTFELGSHRNRNLMIHSLSGKIVASITIPDHQRKYQWQPKKQLSGMYFYQLISDDELIASGKLVFQPDR